MYLDYNATAPVDPRVLERMLPYFSEGFGNASSREHRWGWDAARAVEEARSEVAALINAKPNEIVFSSSATESINLLLKGLPGSPALVISRTEHEAVLAPARQLERSGTWVEYLPADSRGRVEWSSLDGPRRRTGELVGVMLANNETGNIHPLTKIAGAVHRQGGRLFADLTQAAGKIPVDVVALGIDFAAFSAHKLCGPKGAGALYIRGGPERVPLQPLIAGGGQERGVRGGTLNVPAIVGFGEACRIAREEMQVEAARLGCLRDWLERTLLDRLPGVTINGDIDHRLANTSNLSLDGVDGRALIRELHVVGVSTRAACATGAAGPSHVLKAMGLTDAQAYSSIRFSLGRFTTEEEIQRVCGLVTAGVTKLRKR